MGQVNSNNITLNSYDENIAAYVQGTPPEITGDVKRWIDKTLVGLPKDARVIEIGSGFGRAALYLEQHGYSVSATDASEGFVQYMRSQGIQAELFNIITDEFVGDYDLIIADAVLLHLDREQMVEALDKIQCALNPGGRFAFSIKKGEGDEWSESKLGAPRYFCYWQQDDIESVLENAGFQDTWVLDGNEGRSNSDWLNIIAYK